ncbi:hypothetical protein [Aeromonas phage 51]|uniref:Uncharacterized protein n=3 Tax=Popoffvirus pv56 TaxID=2560283 RepID=A0A219YB39_9CAUD|nr:Rz-like spanin [Aeromonas phage vB_AsaM-56]AFC22597.1 hypothetical protein AsaM-56_0001 [Aeromonas phage vB_AsaM-56]APU01224.1 hypothetical protein [Aeromonas phage 51]APU01308.1 hypothetical protein [Aeromonas phage 56]
MCCDPETAPAAIRHNGVLLLDSSDRLRRWQRWWEMQDK